MRQPLRIETKVLRGHRIEIHVPELAVGTEVEVKVEVAVREPVPEAPKQSIIDIINSYDGPRQFKTAEDVDAYLREERDSWER